MDTPFVLTLDGQRFVVRLLSSETALEVLEPCLVTLPAWRYAQHRAAMTRCVQWFPDGPRLDTMLLASLVLGCTVTAPEHVLTQEASILLAPLALWWAAGGAGCKPQALKGRGMWRLGDRVLRLHLWQEQARWVALQRAWLSIPPASASVERFDPEVYLDAMLRACVEMPPGALGLDDLDAPTFQALIHLVLSHNEPASTPTWPEALGRQRAKRTLRLCRALGWTPAQVWSAPAVEMDEVWALLAQLDADPPEPPAPAPAPAVPQQRARLADLPDAVLIRIDD